MIWFIRMVDDIFGDSFFDLNRFVNVLVCVHVLDVCVSVFFFITVNKIWWLYVCVTCERPNKSNNKLRSQRISFKKLNNSIKKRIPCPKWHSDIDPFISDWLSIYFSFEKYILFLFFTHDFFSSSFLLVSLLFITFFLPLLTFSLDCSVRSSAALSFDLEIRNVCFI